MTALTRRESEERHQALLNFFMTNPDATGTEANKALESGRLTGKKGPKMGNGEIFRIRRHALEMLKSAATQISSRPMAREEAAPALAEMRELVAKFHQVMERMPEVTKVVITRTGATTSRTEEREEPL